MQLCDIVRVVVVSRIWTSSPTHSENARCTSTSLFSQILSTALCASHSIFRPLPHENPLEIVKHEQYVAQASPPPGYILVCRLLSVPMIQPPQRDDPRGHRYPGTTPTSASSQHDEHIAHMPPMIVTPARQRRSHGRRYDLGKPTPTPTPTRPAEVERNGNPHTAAGSVVDSDDASGTTRRHSSKRRQHRRRSSAAPVADSATAIAFITDGGSERSGPERELPSSGALPNRVGIVPTSRRDSAVRRKGEIAEAAPQRRSASTSRAVAMRTEGCAGIDEQVSGENEQGKSVGRGGGGGGVVVGDEEQRALSHGVVARGEVQEGVFPNGTPAFLGEEGGAGDAPAMSRRRWSRGSKKVRGQFVLRLSFLL